jgi:probable HAF family extracellular repeat protein
MRIVQALSIFSIAAATLCAGSSAHAEVLYNITMIDTLPGGNGNFALDVNNQRQVTGNSRTTSSSTPLRGYLWSGGTPANLGILTGVNFSRGFAVNDRGVVVGESDNNNSRAFRWENGVLSEVVNTLGGSGGVAFDINNRGDIVGNASNGQAVRPFLVREGSQSMIDLGTHLGTSNSSGRAFAISQDGRIAGLAQTSVAGPNGSVTTSHATLWEVDELGGVSRLDLGALRSATNFSQANGLNSVGQVVGTSVVGTVSPTSSTAMYRGFLWDNGVMNELPILSTQPTFIHSEARDINDAGLAVGYVSRFFNAPSFGGAAVLWRGGQIFDLNALISPGSGWNLLSAEGINDAGDIVGFGTFQGQTRAFLLTAVPEPSSWALLAVGGVAILLGRRVTGRFRAC